MQPTVRPWLSLWITVHFFILSICLLNNAPASELLRRLWRVVAPYAVALHQDYGGVRLELTSGQELDRPSQIEVHHIDQPADQWQEVPVGQTGWVAVLDDRAANFQRMLSIVAEDKNEELLHLLFDQALAQYSTENSDAQNSAIDRIRLLRPAIPSYSEYQLLASGQLPPGSIAPTTVWECRVIALPGGVIRLLPVIDKLRTAPPIGDRP